MAFFPSFLFVMFCAFPHSLLHVFSKFIVFVSSIKDGLQNMRKPPSALFECKKYRDISSISIHYHYNRPLPSHIFCKYILNLSFTPKRKSSRLVQMSLVLVASIITVSKVLICTILWNFFKGSTPWLGSTKKCLIF